MSLLPDIALIKKALAGKCPKCGEGDLFKSRLSLTLNDRCPHCGLDLAANDVGDGPAVFLIFILGFTLVPFALLLEWAAAPPLWLHGIIWTIVALGATLGAMKPLKSYIIALQYKHRPGAWATGEGEEK